MLHPSIGKIPLSKSLLNRALIVKSWFPDFEIEGTSDCDDIQVMTKIVQSLDCEKEFYCGLSATAMRFLMLRLSRKKGDFLLKGESSLLDRPFEDAFKLLPQLGVDISRQKEGFFISSQGWQLSGDYINIPSQVTSQYASAFILNSWNFEKDLFFTLTHQKNSYSYFKMTVDLLKSLGMEIKQSGKEFYIPKNQILKIKKYKPEKDQSCAFALAAFAAFKNQIVFSDWSKESLQPDSVFLEVLKNMGVPVQYKNNSVTVAQAEGLKSISFDVSFYPDLFPILSVLCAKAEGVSELSGISQQAFKESHRLNKVKELLELSGIQTEIKEDKFIIKGKNQWPKVKSFCFDVSNDHRMVMAAELVKYIDTPVTIEDEDSVSKSFPGFFSLVRGV